MIAALLFLSAVSLPINIYLFYTFLAVYVSVQTFFIVKSKNFSSTIQRLSNLKDFSGFVASYLFKVVSGFLNNGLNVLVRSADLVNKLPYILIGAFKIDRHTLERTIKLLLSMTSLIIIFGVLLRVLNLSIANDLLFDHDRFVGFSSNALHYAGYLSVLIVISAALGFFYDLYYIRFLPPLLLGMLMTGSRTYLVSIVAVLLILAAIKSWKYVAGAGLGVGFLIWVLLLFNQTFLARVQSTILLAQNSVRIALWEEAGKIFLQNPIFGVGYTLGSDYILPLKMRGIVDNTEHFHSLYLQEFVELGAVGAAIVLGTLLYFMFKYLFFYLEKKNKLVKYLSLGVSFAILNLFIGGFFEYNYETAIVFAPLMFIMGLLEAYGLSHKKK